MSNIGARPNKKHSNTASKKARDYRYSDSVCIRPGVNARCIECPFTHCLAYDLAPVVVRNVLTNTI